MAVSLFAFGTLIGVSTSAFASHDEASKNMEIMVPGIWVDPDGCQHWVMDDGLEGYMTPNVMPDGRPVCGSKATCGAVSSDHLFRTDEFRVTAAGRKAFLKFFERTGATVFKIEGHTDSRASDAYNTALSRKRANAVAAIAKSAGYAVSEVIAAGESDPRASNATKSGRAKNRRVEIQCVK